jgi:hypothetical protein
LAQDPAAFRRYQLAILGVANLTSKMTATDGSTYVAIPGVGFLTHPIVDALTQLMGASYSLNPTGFGGTLSSANVVFPLSQGVKPDLAPIIVVPAKEIDRMFMELGQNHPAYAQLSHDVNGLTTNTLGPIAMNTSVLEQMIPNAFLYKMGNALSDNGNAYNNALMMTMANLAVQQSEQEQKWLNGGSKGPAPQIFPAPNSSPGVVSAFYAKLRVQTRSAAIVNAIVALVSPIGSTLTVQDFGLRKDLTDDINKYGSVKGHAHFAEMHPFASPFAVGQSTVTQGANLPETVQAMNWVSSRQPEIKANPALLWFMPQQKAAPYAQAAYLQQIGDGLRDRKTPAQFLSDIYTAQGDQVYYYYYAQHAAAITAAGSNAQAKNAEYTKWDAQLQTMQRVMPLWWQSFNSNTRASQSAATITGLGKAFANGTAPAGKQTTYVKALYDAYLNTEQQYVKAGASANYATAQSAVVKTWKAWVDTVAVQQPELAPIITSVFRNALASTNPT